MELYEKHQHKCFLMYVIVVVLGCTGRCLLYGPSDLIGPAWTHAGILSIFGWARLLWRDRWSFRLFNTHLCTACQMQAMDAMRASL